MFIRVNSTYFLVVSLLSTIIRHRLAILLLLILLNIVEFIVADIILTVT